VKARLAVEAGVGQGWEKWVGTQGKLISIERFGASAPARDIFEKFGFSVEAIMEKASGLIHLTL
jgi:transketolase